MQNKGNVDIYRVIIKCKDMDQIVQTKAQLEKTFADRDIYPDKGYPYCAVHLSIPVTPSALTEWDPWYVFDSVECHPSACYIQSIVDYFGADRVEGIAEMMPEWYARMLEAMRKEQEAYNK